MIKTHFHNLYIKLAAATLGIVTITSLLFAPMASALTSTTSGIVVQPVIVQFCPPSQTCPTLDSPFYDTYTVTAYVGKTAVASATTTGPDTYTLGLPAGVYTLDFKAKGYTTEPMTDSITVIDGQYAGPYALHFIAH